MLGKKFRLKLHIYTMSEQQICTISIILSKSTTRIHEGDQLTFNHPHYDKCNSTYKSTNKAYGSFIHGQ
ncbi:hypothetical protein Patl1_13780 [Pistacia atlantica]|uniref:Uncharacterized protein n=1 Tax=Pistacia atlantica TaxID=434234 RepID=A0ACC1AWY0_9ROSI|nr:hypothetical protein Patl1_13780 [Pistacia atlantica]